MRNPRRLRLLAALAAAPLLITACGGGSGDSGDDKNAGESASGGTFSVHIGEPEHLIPQNTNESEGSEVLNALFTGLVTYDQKTTDVQLGDNAPNAHAQSITSDDQTNWTIKLKPGWTFHNGEPVDAASYVRAWNAGALSTNAYGNSYFFENIVGYGDLQAAKEGAEPKAKELSGLKVVDDTTFTVQLNAPFSQFPLTVGYNAFFPLPKSYEADPKAYEEQPVGNGPFQMDGPWAHNQSIKVKRFANYKGTAAKADAVEFKIYSEINTAFNDLLAGNLDIMDDIPPEQLATAKKQFGDRYLERSSSSFTYIGFPTYDKKFADPRLRRAFSMAIDRQPIIDAIFNGSFTPAKSVVSPVVSGSRPDPCGVNCAYDPKAAKALFDEAGGYDGTLTLWFNSGAGHEKWMEAISNQLRQNLGIQKVEFKSLDFAEYLGLLDEKKVTGPFRLGWVMDYPSPQNYLQPIYSTTGSSNNFGYSNPKVDDLIKQGNAAKDVDAGIALYNQAEDLILQDMPVIPMWFGKVQGGHSDKVDNVQIDAFSNLDIASVTVKK
jgi:ABC-type oligopeptide transport system substrate-binding subunit